MKILYICNEYPPYKHGGIGAFVKNLAENIYLSGIDCIVAGIYDIDQNVIEKSNGVIIYRFKLPIKIHNKKNRYLNVIYQIFERYYLSRKIKFLEKKHQIDLIESYEWTGPLFYKPNSPLLIRLHGSHSAHSVYEKKKKNGFLFFWESRNLSMADFIVSVSFHMLKSTEKRFSIQNKKKYVIYNSVNVNVFYPVSNIDRNPYKIIFVGKFNERKGVFELFHILNFLLKLNFKYEFGFIGNHQEENKITLLNILDIELRERVSFTNSIPQEQLPEIYNQAALLIMPSRAEAFGLTVIEAMASGCLVAMSNIEVGYELINDGIDGILINSYNYEESSKKIDTLLRNHKQSDIMRINALEKVDNLFSSHVIIQSNINLYENIIQ